MGIGRDTEIDHAHRAEFGMRAASNSGKPQLRRIKDAAVAPIRDAIVDNQLTDDIRRIDRAIGDDFGDEAAPTMPPCAIGRRRSIASIMAGAALDLIRSQIGGACRQQRRRFDRPQWRLMAKEGYRVIDSLHPLLRLKVCRLPRITKQAASEIRAISLKTGGIG